MSSVRWIRLKPACGVRAFLLCLFWCLLPAVQPCPAYGPESNPPDFTSLSIEELMNYEITSVSKKPQKLAETAAAVFVITQEDIRRSGFTTLPDLLRMVPGMQVAKSDPGDYAVSARGFLGEFANKLLVLVDGRSIYSPLFSGVFWDFHDMLLDTIERIEVIRGPGATMWGSNAVNGVINIITKHSRDTAGAFATATVGTTDEWYAAVRYGGSIGSTANYSMYIKQTRFGTVDNRLQDEPAYSRAGVRVDWEPTDRDAFTFTGGFYSGRETARTVRPLIRRTPEEVLIKGRGVPSGHHLLGRWTHAYDGGAETSVQVYYDAFRHRARRTAYDRRFRDNADLGRDAARMDTFDLDVQHRLASRGRHEIIAGAGFRLTRDYKRDRNVFYTLRPKTRYTHIYSGFVQDDITLLPEVLTVTVGAKFEYNSYTNGEIQPTARLLWRPTRRQSVWAAVSRAVRIPARIERDGHVRLGTLPRGAMRPVRSKGLIVWGGADSFDAEQLTACELGYRVSLTDTLSLDTAAFLNVYRDLRTLEPGPVVRRTGYPLLTLTSANKMDGKTYGLESAANWQARPWWRLQAAFTWLQMNLDAKTGSRAARSTVDEKLSPSTQVSVRSLMDISRKLELDTGLYFVDDIPGLDIRRYANLTVRLGWKPIPSCELSLIGQNLLDRTHNEFSDEIYQRAENRVRRTFYGRITWYLP
jgi:iron complex outermembrane recepter protein